MSLVEVTAAQRDGNQGAVARLPQQVRGAAEAREPSHRLGGQPDMLAELHGETAADPTREPLQLTDAQIAAALQQQPMGAGQDRVYPGGPGRLGE